MVGTSHVVDASLFNGTLILSKGVLSLENENKAPVADLPVPLLG